MKILVINAGSSSLKFTLYSMKTEQMIAKGQIERIGLTEPKFQYKRNDGIGIEISANIKNHVDALKLICEKLVDKEVGVLQSLKE